MSFMTAPIPVADDDHSEDSAPRRLEHSLPGVSSELHRGPVMQVPIGPSGSVLGGGHTRKFSEVPCQVRLV